MLVIGQMQACFCTCVFFKLANLEARAIRHEGIGHSAANNQLVQLNNAELGDRIGNTSWSA